MNEASKVIDELLSAEIFTLHGTSFTYWNLLWLSLTLFVTWLVLRLVKLFFKRQVVTRGMDRGNVAAILKLIQYFAYTIAVVILLENIGVNMTVLLTGSAALLIGVGLGLQQLFYDIVSGILLLFEGTIRVGDIVEVKQQIVGRVMDIGLRTSKIETRENTYVIVPNSKFISGDVVNWSHITTSTRFSVAVGVAYGSDVQLVKKCLLQAASEEKGVEELPAPFVRFDDFGDSALIFDVYFWTTDTFLVENMKSDMRFKIDHLFRENNIQIPFPQRDLHIKQIDPTVFGVTKKGQ